MSLVSPKKIKVALGMSGGVDSSLCAHLLKEQGYEVTGVYLECWRAPGCRTEEDRKDALDVALALDIPFTVLDFKQQYKDKVVEYFFDEYQAGRTPNPDVMCNKEIKFGLFYDWAISQGFDYVATGHYAKIVDGQLAIPADTHKDQTYFLYLLEKSQLEHVLFPLADLTKAQVRLEAKARSIKVADKKDSVGICFIGDINVHDFLRERLGENPGDVVDAAGRVIGRHKGLWFYTIGQRHGFTIQPTTKITDSDGQVIEQTNLPPFYVIRKNPAQNQLVVGFGVEALSGKFELENAHWIDGGVDSEVEGAPESIALPEVFVRIRHTGALLPAKVVKGTSSRFFVELKEPVMGVAEGQSGVVYFSRGGRVICAGGGSICLDNTKS